jgi:xanthine dehydrogenase accessory factor
MDVLDEAVLLRRQGRRCALATIVAVNGSIPSYESARILVRDDGSMGGTIGGGCVEAEVYTAAREVIESGKPRRLEFTLGNDAAYDSGLICGGQLEVFIEPLIPQPRAFVFGAGHIPKGLCSVLTLYGFAVEVLGDRESFANVERFPEAEAIHAADYEAIFPLLAIHSSSYIVIVTRGHRDDMRILRWAVSTPARYIAMIGSKRKVIAVVKELEKEGLPQSSFDRLHAPMGLDIGAVTPEEIAVSVAAEMIAVRRGAESNWPILTKSIFHHPELRALIK